MFMFLLLESGPEYVRNAWEILQVKETLKLAKACHLLHHSD